MVKNPKISVFTTCYNSGKYIQDTLDSIFRQDFDDYEIILVDAGSNDDTHEKLELYKSEKRLKVFTELGCNSQDGFMTALNYASGDYVMCMPISDCYSGNSWFKNCVNVLDNNNDISLVHGMSVAFNDSYDTTIAPTTLINPPSGKAYIKFWFARFYLYGEHTYCVRKNVYTECVNRMIPGQDEFMLQQSKNVTNENFLFFNFDIQFSYNFNSLGYLSHFIPKIAGHIRKHEDSVTNDRLDIDLASAEFYIEKVIDYKEQVFKGKVVHSFRNGGGEIIDVIKGAKLNSLIKDVITYRLTNDKFAFNYNDQLSQRFTKLMNFIKKIIVKIIRNVIWLFYYKNR